MPRTDFFSIAPTRPEVCRDRLPFPVTNWCLSCPEIDKTDFFYPSRPTRLDGQLMVGQHASSSLKLVLTTSDVMVVEGTLCNGRPMAKNDARITPCASALVAEPLRRAFAQDPDEA